MSDRTRQPFVIEEAVAILSRTPRTLDALLRGRPWSVALDDLLTASGEGAPKEELAVTLMGYARSSPDRINGRLTPVIVYDPDSGREAFSITLKKLKE